MAFTPVYYPHLRQCLVREWAVTEAYGSLAQLASIWICGATGGSGSVWLSIAGVAWRHGCSVAAGHTASGISRSCGRRAVAGVVATRRSTGRIARSAACGGAGGAGIARRGSLRVFCSHIFGSHAPGYLPVVLGRRRALDEDVIFQIGGRGAAAG